MSGAPQPTDAWLVERAGHVTASCFDAVLSKIKTGEAVGRRKLRTRLVTERLTGLPTPSFKNAAIEWGTNTEPFGRIAFEVAEGLLAIEVPFRKHPRIEWCGCSPDGEIGDDGLLEIKCPESTTHLDYLIAGTLPSEYVPQVQGQMWVTGRKWCFFASFDPRMPANLQLFRVRVERDEEYIANLEREVVKFNAEVAEMYERLMRLAA